MDNQASVDDSELNQMIAGLGGSPVPNSAPAPQIISHTATPQTQPMTPVAPLPAPGPATIPAPVLPMPASQNIPALVPGPVIVPVSVPQNTPVPPVVPESTPTPEVSDSPDLSEIKQDALKELRPLVEKLDLPAEEKFNTLLLMIRSTDDGSLLPEIYAAAKTIPDETRRAEALLNVIKEIDYFGQSRN